MVVTDMQDDLIGGKPFPHQFQRELICHFAADQLSLFRCIRLREHLSLTDAAALRPIRLDLGECRRLPAPCVVNDQLGIDAEDPEEPVLAGFRKPRKIAHRIDIFPFQPPRRPNLNNPRLRILKRNSRL